MPVSDQFVGSFLANGIQHPLGVSQAAKDWMSASWSIPIPVAWPTTRHQMSPTLPYPTLPYPTLP